MATITFDLTDREGNAAEIGDIVEVMIPEIASWHLGELDYYRPATNILAKIMMPPSKGLQLKVIEVIGEYPAEDGMDCDHITPGQKLNFRRTVWKWKIVP